MVERLCIHLMVALNHIYHRFHQYRLVYLRLRRTSVIRWQRCLGSPYPEVNLYGQTIYLADLPKSPGNGLPWRVQLLVHSIIPLLPLPRYPRLVVIPDHPYRNLHLISLYYLMIIHLTSHYPTHPALAILPLTSPRPLPSLHLSVSDVASRHLLSTSLLLRRRQMVKVV